MPQIVYYFKIFRKRQREEGGGPAPSSQASNCLRFKMPHFSYRYGSHILVSLKRGMGEFLTVALSALTELSEKCPRSHQGFLGLIGFKGVKKEFLSTPLPTAASSYSKQPWRGWAPGGWRQGARLGSGPRWRRRCSHRGISSGSPLSAPTGKGAYLLLVGELVTPTLQSDSLTFLNSPSAWGCFH